MTTHQVTIRYNAANPAVLAWLQKIAAQAQHPQYQGDIQIGQPEPIQEPSGN